MSRSPRGPCGRCVAFGECGRRPPWSLRLHSRLCLLRSLDLALPEHGLDARHLPAYLADARSVVELSGDQLETEVEQFLARLVEPVLQLFDVHVAELFRLGGHR